MAVSKNVSCGLDFCSVPDLKDCLYVANCSKYHFVCIPLVHPNYKREFISPEIKRSEPWTRSDLILCSSDWSTLVVGKLSPHIYVDSKIHSVAKNSEETLLQELALASHLGLVAITIKLKGNIENNMNLARIMFDKLSTTQNFQAQVWIQVPMENPKKQAYSYREDIDLDKTEIESTWQWWNQFRIVCDYDRKLIVALIVSNDLPDEDEITRWLGEPVKCLIIPTTVFITNKNGFPVLSKAHQAMIRKFCALDVQFVITGANRHQNIIHYYHYMDHLWKNWQPNGPIERFARGYEDYLQCPLQPLMDNLESGTYEVFEKDPIKYAEYQAAIESALKDIGSEKEARNEKDSIVVMVVGAGRGPLVRAALNASANAKRQIKVYAVEKNPNAVLTLQALQQEMWGDVVTIVSSDMRDWNAPEKADILVSELLGSFGDNELSPECLDGVQKFLKDDGISIPYSYTSYIAPVQSSKLYNEVKGCRDKDKHSLAHFEMPYVVHFQNKYDIDLPQPLFTFNHPNKDAKIDNSRYGKNIFKAEQDCVLHGFSGYFLAILYKNIKISIEPRTHSPRMFSWFPIFFPIKDPVNLKAGDEIVSHFWRCCSSKNVWYEWSVEKPVPIPIHNPCGRSSTIGL
ncbi:protein arginine N-methyltransferase 5 [Nasonia vitripennis]|uniref:Protein arginine N-methyltransferase n=1 Tax=Nasonia vitripennis TaxID=7425 RepID=A0A7M7G5J0_NASVI|nr:protein arginine N-methyltransferase 5 [Nasonia vitripennis]XP_031782069.1 protein arginine N-methyltransferase 5 [Nasonia vitripennis]